MGFYTLGCKLNFAETASISRNFIKAGYEKAEEDTPADVYVINTCSVTENANKRFRALVKKLNRLNPEAVIVATGCYAQLEPEALAKLDQVDLVVGIQDKFRILEFLQGLQKRSVSEVHACEIENVRDFDAAYSTGERTRSFLKIQDGCDYKCTYCTIPKARGISRSDSIENILRQAREIATSGIREVVLTGVNIGDFGKGTGERLIDLIHALDKVEDIERYRISSIEPDLLSEDIIRFVAASSKFVPHFHLPLQSGSDTLLRRMKRRYDTQLYRQRVEIIRKIMPDAAIGVDVIVGFPGETDEIFLETYRFLESLDIAYLHVFTYSERKGTEAAVMRESVPLNVRKKRSKILRALSWQKKNEFYRKRKGILTGVLFEPENRDGYIYGFTDNYIRVKVPYDSTLAHRIMPVRLLELEEDVMTGEIVTAV